MRKLSDYKFRAYRIREEDYIYNFSFARNGLGWNAFPIEVPDPPLEEALELYDGRNQVGDPFIAYGDFTLIDWANLVGWDWIIEQWTGLKDAENTDLYEGDIVFMPNWSPAYMQISFMEGAFCLADVNGEYVGDIHYIQHAEHSQAYIKGNIHDNFNLLKDQK